MKVRLVPPKFLKTIYDRVLRPFTPERDEITGALIGDFSTAPSATNAHLIYRAARRRHPVAYDPKMQTWTILDFENVNWCLKNPGFFNNEYSVAFDPFLAGTDGDAHVYFRQALSRQMADFKPATMSAFGEEWMRAFVDKVKHRRSFDVVKELSVPLPRAFTAKLLGLAPEEQRRVEKAQGINRTDINGSLQGVGRALAKVMKDIQVTPRSGIMSGLIHAPENERMSLDQIMSLSRHVWFAGTVTLSILIPSAVSHLIKYPRIAAKLRRDDSLIPKFVSEILRLEAPTQFVMRKAVKDYEVAGVTIPTNALVRLCLASANRDPSVFPKPDTLDLERPINRHLSFGAGDHFCIGMMIARTLANVMIGRLLTEFPRMRHHKKKGSLQFEKSPLFRAINACHVKV